MQPRIGTTIFRWFLVPGFPRQLRKVVDVHNGIDALDRLARSLRMFPLFSNGFRVQAILAAKLEEQVEDIGGWQEVLDKAMLHAARTAHFGQSASEGGGTSVQHIAQTGMFHILRSELPSIMPASRNRQVRLARPLLSSGVPRRLGSHMRLRSPRPQIPLRQLSSVQRQLEMVLWMRLPCVSQHEAHPRLRVPARFRHLRRTVTVPPTPTTAVLQLKSSRPPRLPQPG